MQPMNIRRVAVIGGVRIPFCRSNTLYADASNLDMMSAALNGLVERYKLAGVHIDEVIGGATSSDVGVLSVGIRVNDKNGTLRSGKRETTIYKPDRIVPFSQAEGHPWPTNSITSWWAQDRPAACWPRA